MKFLKLKKSYAVMKRITVLIVTIIIIYSLRLKQVEHIIPYKYIKTYASIDSKISVSFKMLEKDKNYLPNCPQVTFGQYNHGIPIDNYHMIKNYNLSEDSIYPTSINNGGSWYPTTCTSVHEPIALIVPVRGRLQQLALYLSRIHPFLQQQNIPYIIITVNQSDKLPFNRGLLLNIGVLYTPESINCFILSDVDMIPDRYENMYICNKSHPKHISTAISKFNWKLLYPTYFGGVIAITRKQFSKINGFSNKYWGWGAEDDDFYRRVVHVFGSVDRVSYNVGRMIHLNHYKNESAIMNEDRFSILQNGTNLKIDGINSSRSFYQTECIKYTLLRTDIIVHCKNNTTSIN